MRQAGIQAINQVGNANINSPAFDFRQFYRLSGQVVVGAGANTAGSLQLQFSNDPIAQVNFGPSGVVTGVVNWTNFGTAVTVNGAAVQAILFSTIPWTDIGFAWMRAVYTDSSSGTGLGLVSVNLNVQGF